MDLKSPSSHRPTLYGTKHMVVSGHPLATMAGMRVLEAGGNAVDAGVAAGFALNVVQPDMANLGGVAPIALYTAASGSVATFNGVGRWPMNVTRDDLQRSGGGRIPTDHRRWVVPAAVAAWLSALEWYGTLSAGEVMAPAIELARRGFPANYFTRHNLEVAKQDLLGWPHSREVFLPRGEVPRLGEPIVQDALADTLEALAEAERRASGDRRQGIRAARDRFYRGDIARAIDAFARDLGAYLRFEDLAGFAVHELPPVRTSFRGQEVLSCGPWCQGPALLQALNVLEPFPLADMEPAEATHLMIEAVNLALLERNRWYGDPDVVDVPIERLLSAEHAAELRAGLDEDRSVTGGPSASDAAVTPDTTYVAVVDADGNAFSATPSDSTMLFTPMVPGLGIAVSNRGGQASLDPDDPNVVAPGKRPRMTPNPGIVLGPHCVMPYGTPGGDVQTQAMLQFLVKLLDPGLEPQAAVEQPRWASYAVPITEDPHPSKPHLVRIEGPLFDQVAEALTAKGHRVERWPTLAADAGGVCAIRLDLRTGVLAGAADPRRMSYGIGW